MVAHVGLIVGEWSSDLGLYPTPPRWWFDRRLHVVFTARPE